MVKIGNSFSQSINVKSGVPQGSNLEPILYLIYTNSLLNILKNSTAYAYAYDTVVIVSDINLETTINTMQDEINIITNWSHDNRLRLNADKTKIIHIKPHCVHKKG